MIRSRTLPVLLAACGPMSAEQFEKRSIEATCEFIVECYAEEEYYEDVQRCIEELTDANDPIDPDCDYDADAARECVEGMRDVPCPPDGEPPPVVDACLAVYTCRYQPD